MARFPIKESLRYVGKGLSLPGQEEMQVGPDDGEKNPLGRTYWGTTRFYPGTTRRT